MTTKLFSQICTTLKHVFRIYRPVLEFRISELGQSISSRDRGVEHVEQNSAMVGGATILFVNLAPYMGPRFTLVSYLQNSFIHANNDF